jgi:NAD+ kinase
MNICFIASPRPAAQDIVRQLADRYGQCEPAGADYLVVVGGDGTVLKALHATLETPGKPVFAMRLGGSLGVLANRLDLAGLPDRLRSARRISLRPLRAEARDTSGRSKTIYGINEIALGRERLQAAHLTVTINRTATLPQIVGDGLVVATPIGSTGYNHSLGGPELPLDLPLLALTGISVSRVSHWTNRVVDDSTIIDVAVLEPQYRPVRLETSLEDFFDLSDVRITRSHEVGATLLREQA